MAIELPKNRLNVRQTKTVKRNIPLEQIIAVEGQSPIATGIETAGNVVGQAIQRRAELQRQGQQLAQLESLGGFGQGQLAGLDVSTASALTSKNRDRGFDVQDAARKMQENTMKVRALESQFKNELGYKPGELGDDYPSALMKVQNDLQVRRADSGPAADRAKQIEKGRYRNYLLDMEQRDPVIKEINKQGLSLGTIDSLKGLVENGNTVAFSALGTKMARGMGEVGVLTEQDIKRYVQSGALTRRSADTLLSWVQGRPTQATLDEVGEISSALRTAFQEKAQPRYDQYINSYSNIEGLTPEEFATKLSLTYGGARRPINPINPPKPQAIKAPLSDIEKRLLDKHK